MRQVTTHLGVPECEGGALTPAVDEGRGRLGVGGRDLGGAGHCQAGQGEAEEEGPGLHDSCWLVCVPVLMTVVMIVTK